MARDGEQKWFDRAAKRCAPALLSVALLVAHGTATGVAETDEIDASELGIEIEGMPAKAQFCMIMVTQPGILGASYDGRLIGSRESGGAPGRAEVLATNSRYRLMAIAPLEFTAAPPGLNAGLRFDAFMKGTGSTNFDEQPGSQAVRVKRGSTIIEANVSVANLDGAFPSGSYATELTLRCE